MQGLSFLHSFILSNTTRDWMLPEPHEYPKTSDQTAQPPGFDVGPLPSIPQGSLYSPSLNMWKLPSGHLVDAGDFRPLPKDKNTYDSQEFMDSSAVKNMFKANL